MAFFHVVELPLRQGAYTNQHTGRQRAPHDRNFKYFGVVVIPVVQFPCSPPIVETALKARWSTSVDTDILTVRYIIITFICSALYISCFLVFFIYVLATFVGLVIYAYYAGCDPLRMRYISSSNQVSDSALDPLVGLVAIKFCHELRSDVRLFSVTGHLSIQSTYTNTDKQ